mgnify:CR=1 FL=1
MGRKPKLTTSPNDEKYQRDQTEELIEATKNLEPLQTSAPAYLKGRARYQYEQLVPVLRESQWVKNLDVQIVASLCVNYQLLQDGYKDINEHGQTYMSENGSIRKNPNVDIVNNATKNIKALSSDLGLTPASRATLFNVEPETGTGVSMNDMKAKFGVKTDD